MMVVVVVAVVVGVVVIVGDGETYGGLIPHPYQQLVPVIQVDYLIFAVAGKIHPHRMMMGIAFGQSVDLGLVVVVVVVVVVEWVGAVQDEFGPW